MANFMVSFNIYAKLRRYCDNLMMGQFDDVIIIKNQTIQHLKNSETIAVN